MSAGHLLTESIDYQAFIFIDNLEGFKKTTKLVSTHLIRNPMLSSGSTSLLSILLSLLIGLSSLTFGADLHYCQGQLISIGLLGKARSCHQTGSDVSCRSSGKCCKSKAPVAEEIRKEKCCHNKLVVVEGIDHEKLRARAGLSFPPGAQAILIKVSTQNVPGPIRVNHCYLPLSAWDQLQDLNVLYQRFLI